MQITAMNGFALKDSMFPLKTKFKNLVNLNYTHEQQTNRKQITQHHQ